ncbi:DapH/DapD/GlmU-related protein [Vibrio cyclitrophicus]
MSLWRLSVKQFCRRGYVLFKGVDGNHISIAKLASKSKMLIDIRKRSIGNKIIFESGFSGRVDIKISGDNNTLYVGKNTILDNVKVEILSNNAVMAIGEGVSMGKGRLNISDASGQFSSIVSGKAHVLSENMPKSETIKLTVGDGSMIAEGVTMMTADGHPILNSEGIKISSYGDIVLGKHVWVGANATILKGVTVGRGSVIGLNSVVTKSIPENTIAVGTPCKPIKRDFGFWARSVSTSNIEAAKQRLDIN